MRYLVVVSVEVSVGHVCHMSEKYGTYNVRLLTTVSFIVRDSSNSGSREPKRRRLHGDRLALFDFDAKEVERFVLNK